MGSKFDMPDALLVARYRLLSPVSLQYAFDYANQEV